MVKAQLFATALTVALLSATHAYSQASLVAEDTIDDLKVTTNSLSETFTVVRDAFERDQWYYVPDTPRLYERIYNGTIQPEFTLIKYNFDDPQHPGSFLSGGLLQFAASLSIPADIVEQLRKQVETRTHQGPEHVRLAAMPMKSSQVSLYTPQAGTLLASAPNGAGLGPTFESQKLVFSIPLTEIGADVYSGLTTSNTGVPVRVDYSYYGTTPPAGFTVTVHWDQTFSHYSSDSQFRAQASWFGLYGASYSSSSKSILENLINNHCVDVKITTGENFTMEQVQGYLQPILARINSELLDASKPPDKVDPAQAPSAGGGGGVIASASYSVAMKNVNQHKSGDETFDFHVTSIVERHTVVQGEIGIGAYSPEIQKKLVFFATGTFHRSYLTLPVISSDDALGVSSATVSVKLIGGSPERELATRSATWSPQGGWSDGTAFLAFELDSYQLDGAELSALKLAIDTTVNMRKGSPLQYTETIPAFNGKLPIVKPPQNEIDIVSIDATHLKWQDLDASSNLTQINVVETSGNRTYSTTIAPPNENGKWTLPKVSYWVVHNGDPIIVKLTFKLADGKTVPWSGNGDLRAQSLSPMIVLQNSDWSQPTH